MLNLMIGILFIYFIGRYFYKLVETFKKKKWIYTILGVVAYYLLSAFFGMIYFVAVDFYRSRFSDNIPVLFWSFLSIPFGLGGCYLFYKYLERKWKSEKPDSFNEMDQIGRPEM